MAESSTARVISAALDALPLLADIAHGLGLTCQSIETKLRQRGGRNRLSRIGSMPRSTTIQTVEGRPSGRANRIPGKINQRSIGGGLGVVDMGADFGAREQFGPLQGRSKGNSPAGPPAASPGDARSCNPLSPRAVPSPSVPICPTCPPQCDSWARPIGAIVASASGTIATRQLSRAHRLRVRARESAIRPLLGYGASGLSGGRGSESIPGRRKCDLFCTPNRGSDAKDHPRSRCLNSRLATPPGDADPFVQPDLPRQSTPEVPWSSHA
jgi:hypothetical protein